MSNYTFQRVVRLFWHFTVTPLNLTKDVLVWLVLSEENRRHSVGQVETLFLHTFFLVFTNLCGGGNCGAVEMFIFPFEEFYLS